MTAKKKKKLTKSKITCTKCQTTKGMSKGRCEKLTAKFGTLKKLHDEYVCRDCRRELNVRADGKLKPVKRKRKEKKDLSKSEFLKNFTVDRKTTPCSNEELKAVGACWRPDLWIKNGKACNDCPHYGVSCGCKKTKILSKKKLEAARAKAGKGRR